MTGVGKGEARREDGLVNTEGEAAVMSLQAKEHLK